MRKWTFTYSLKGRSCLKYIKKCVLKNLKNVKNAHGGMSLLVKLHAYITGNIIQEVMSIQTFPL